MGSKIKVLSIFTLILFIQNSRANPVSPSNTTEKPKIPEDIYDENEQEAGEKANETAHSPEMSHLMSSLVSLLPDDIENSLRKDGFTVFLDKSMSPDQQKSLQHKPAPTAVHGGVRNPSLPKASSGHFLHHISMGPDSKHQNKVSHGPGLISKQISPPRKPKKLIDQQPVIFTLTSVERSMAHAPPALAHPPRIPQPKRNGSLHPDIPIHDITTFEVETKTKITKIKVHPTTTTTPKPRPRKVSKPIIIVLEETSMDDPIHAKEKKPKSVPKNSPGAGQPDLSSLFHVLSLLEHMQGHPLSVIPSSRRKDLEDTIDCINCKNGPAYSKMMFDLDVLPQLVLSNSSVNAMGTPFDIIGNRLVKRQTS